MSDSVKVEWKNSVFDLKKVRSIQDSQVYLGRSKLMLLIDTNSYIRRFIKIHEVAVPDAWRVLRTYGIFGSRSQRKNAILVPLQIAQVDFIIIYS